MQFSIEWYFVWSSFNIYFNHNICIYWVFLVAVHWDMNIYEHRLY